VLANIPIEVASVVAGGYWKEGGSDGRYRVVVINEGWEHVHSRVYAQWIRTNQEERSEQVINTVRIREIDSGGWWSVGAPVFLPSEPGAARIRLDASDSQSSKATSFLLSLKARGKYEIRRATKPSS
jgi:hypothetical protein